MVIGAMNDKVDSEKVDNKVRSPDVDTREARSNNSDDRPRGGDRGPSDDRPRGGDRGGSFDRGGPMEVVVSHNIEKAMKILKRKLIKEGLFKELKARRFFEKPSIRRKRKEKEARKKQRKDEARLNSGPGLL